MPTAVSDVQLTGDRQVLKLCLLAYLRVDLSFSSISAAEDTQILVVLQTSDQTYFVRKFVHFCTQPAYIKVAARHGNVLIRF